MSKELTPEMLDELSTEIKSYFGTYYSALRNEIAGHDALYDSIPKYLQVNIGPPRLPAGAMRAGRPSSTRPPYRRTGAASENP